MFNEECGYSIFNYFAKLQPLSGEDIAQVPMWGRESTFSRVFANKDSDYYLIDFTGDKITTRQHVSAILKKSMGKIYTSLKNEEPESTPFQIASSMFLMFGINHCNEKEVKKFFRLFPKKIKNDIIEDGRETLNKLCGTSAL